MGERQRERVREKERMGEREREEKREISKLRKASLVVLQRIVDHYPGHRNYI